MKKLLVTAALCAAAIAALPAQSTSNWGVKGPIRLTGIPDFEVVAFDIKSGVPIILKLKSISAASGGGISAIGEILVLSSQVGNNPTVLYTQTGIPVTGKFQHSESYDTRFFNSSDTSATTRGSITKSTYKSRIALSGRGNRLTFRVTCNREFDTTTGSLADRETEVVTKGNPETVASLTIKADRYRGTSVDEIANDIFDTQQFASVRTTNTAFPTSAGASPRFRADGTVWNEGTSEDFDNKPFGGFSPTAFPDGAGGTSNTAGRLYAGDLRRPGSFSITLKSPRAYNIQVGMSAYTRMTSASMATFLSSRTFTYQNVVGDNNSFNKPEELQVKTSWKSNRAFLVTTKTNWDKGSIDDYLNFVEQPNNQVKQDN